MLRPDTTDKGMHAVHVKRHRKMGKHCTIIHTAKLIVDDIISMSDVREVRFGRIRCLYGRGKVSMRMQSEGVELLLWIQNPDRLQTFKIIARSEDRMQHIIRVIKGFAARHHIPAV